MPKVIHQPSDKLFKQSLADLRVAQDFFTAHLPPELLAQTDLSTLKLVKNSFIDQLYKASEADVVYQVMVAGKPVFFYLLCEHQNKIDQYIAFRIMKYVLHLMDYHLQQHPGSPLPVVYSLVLYTGAAEYTAPRDIYEMFGEQVELARRVVFQPYQLIDLHRIPDADLQQHPWAGIFEFVLKYQQFRNFESFIKKFMSWLLKLGQMSSDKSDYFMAMVTYVVNNMEAGDEELFSRYTNEYLPSPLREDVMTISQSIEKRGLEKGRQEGFQQGKQQGLQQGREEGLQQGREEGSQQGKQQGSQQKAEHIARELLKDGHYPLTEIARVTGLSQAALKNLAATVLVD